MYLFNITQVSWFQFSTFFFVYLAQVIHRYTGTAQKRNHWRKNGNTIIIPGNMKRFIFRRYSNTRLLIKKRVLFVRIFLFLPLGVLCNFWVFHRELFQYSWILISCFLVGIIPFEIQYFTSWILLASDVWIKNRSSNWYFFLFIFFFLFGLEYSIQPTIVPAFFTLCNFTSNFHFISFHLFFFHRL